MRFPQAYTENRRKLLFVIFDKFPDLSNRGTAAILVRDYPEYFKDFEDARHLVRLYRGKGGKWDREHIAIKKYYR
jgi:hypothetical protein